MLRARIQQEIAEIPIFLISSHGRCLNYSIFFIKFTLVRMKDLIFLMVMDYKAKLISIY